MKKYNPIVLSIIATISMFTGAYAEAANGWWASPCWMLTVASCMALLFHRYD